MSADTAPEIVQAFYRTVAEHLDVGAEFVRARDLWHTAADAASKELAEAAGEAFALMCDVYGDARGRAVGSHERDTLRALVRSPRTSAEEPN